MSRLHAALANLSPGGISKELNASDAIRLLNNFEPVTAVEQTRYDLAVLSRLVGGADRRPASKCRVTPVMVVGVEESVKCPGPFGV